MLGRGLYSWGRGISEACCKDVGMRMMSSCAAFPYSQLVGFSPHPLESLGSFDFYCVLLFPRLLFLTSKRQRVVITLLICIDASIASALSWQFKLAPGTSVAPVVIASTWSSSRSISSLAPLANNENPPPLTASCFPRVRGDLGHLFLCVLYYPNLGERCPLLSSSCPALPCPVLNGRHGFNSRGIRALFRWQAHCLRIDNGKPLRGGNLVYR